MHALIGSQCCIYINDSSYEICQKATEAETHAHTGAQRAYNPPESDWLQNLFSGWGLSSWFSSLFSSLLNNLLPMVITLLSAYCGFTCICLQNMLIQSIQER